jgi:hypothetical protein
MEVTIQGNVKPDGSLELLAVPSLPAGPVEVVIRSSQPAAATEDWWAYLQRARRELESAGHIFRTKEDIDAEIAALRADA